MATQYGPWATLIDAGGNPQLSSFWRRRLTMLVPTSQTSPVLSRQNLLWLGAAAVLMIVLPTFRAAPVVAEEEKMTKSGIVLPDTVEKKKQSLGQVIAVGPGKMTGEGKIIPMSVVVGTKVLFKEPWGEESKIKDGDKKFLLVEEEDVLAVIE